MRWFHNFNIGTKLLSAFVAVAVIAAAIGWIGYVQVSTMTANLHLMYIDRLVPLRDLGYANAALLIARGEIANVLLAASPEEQRKYLAVVDEQSRKIDELIARYNQTQLIEEERKTLTLFLEAWQKYQAERAKAIELLMNQRPLEARQIIDTTARPYLTEARQSLRALIDVNARVADEIERADEAGAVAAQKQILVFMALGIGAAIGLGIVIARAISRPLKLMAGAANQLALGDLEQEVAVTSRDEIGTLAAAFRSMIDSQKQFAAAAAQIAGGNISASLKVRCDKDILSQSFEQLVQTLQALIAETSQLTQWSRDGQLSQRGDLTKFQGAFRDLVRGINDTIDAILKPIHEAGDVLEKVAGRDLTARVQGSYNGDHAKIKEALNRAVENLDGGLAHIALGAEQVAAASNQISSGSQSLAQGASEQASSLEEVSSSLQEMASMSKQNAANAKEARQLAEGASASADQGVDSMNRLSSAIDKIKDSSDQTAKIIKTIDEIAFQTNLLALNAAVEAARAGDAGKGFAVVAEEVRNLAMRSAEAAKNTASMIETSVKNAEGGVAINQEVLKKLHAISDQVRRVTEVMAEIAAASDQQNEGVEQVTTTVEQMNQVTQQTAVSAEESASAAEELTSQSREMKAMVAGFRLTSAAEVASQRREATPGKPASVQNKLRTATQRIRVVSDAETAG